MEHARRRVEARWEEKEGFYAKASWLSTTKILSITEKRILLNSLGIDIHSEACYVKVTAGFGVGGSARKRETGCGSGCSSVIGTRTWKT